MDVGIRFELVQVADNHGWDIGPQFVPATAGPAVERMQHAVVGADEEDRIAAVGKVIGARMDDVAQHRFRAAIAVGAAAGNFIGAVTAHVIEDLRSLCRIADQCLLRQGQAVPAKRNLVSVILHGRNFAARIVILVLHVGAGTFPQLGDFTDGAIGIYRVGKNVSAPVFPLVITAKDGGITLAHVVVGHFQL